MSDLARYEAKAKGMRPEELKFAIKDIQDTMQCWRDVPISDPYIAKLYAEFDAYTVELFRRGA